MTAFLRIMSVVQLVEEWSAFNVLGKFRAAIARANQVPTKKFLCPQTEAQEIGWITQPLVCTVLIYPSN